MTYVEVWDLAGPKPDLVRTATIAWDGREWHVNPPEEAEVLLAPLCKWRTEEMITADADPIRFLQTLHDQCRSSYHWVTAPKEGTPPPITGDHETGAFGTGQGAVPPPGDQASE